ncbi:Concanavalin A-like lectin/glucanases superfamily protein [Rhizobium tibeticum]|uniref:Concanavalin A-like lectin/glucanases superfamily protein n=1 Tax=Rhizobium tibeticum TaxID=501024 RepID=A0A1H8DCU2_9HYPH|nr:LamG domain-containing protein [Rhizobium tibeticum]SEH51322.1 hypothetical protein RTCCBAU85039_0830 [Rhizobium tibeticum]SEN05069.1 Concanavalin A-like lectin/glucanases superfamily protein [Rhizobium tibeticum]
MTTAYTTGQITLTNGSAVVTGAGTAWAISLVAGGIVAPQASGNMLPIASVNSDTQITAATEWVGASGTYDYAIIRDTAYLQQLTTNSNTLAQLIAELATGTVFKFDASGDLAGRASYNDRAKGFSYLVVIGVTQPQLYVKASATSADWAGPFSYGTGPKGDKGDVGDTGLVNWRGVYSGATVYAKNDGVYDTGSAWIALQATTGHAPPSLPTTSNAYWSLMAIKGTDGTGTGDVVGPNGGVTDGYLVAFNGGTGKLVKQLTPAMVKTLLAYSALDVSFDNSVANLAGAPATVQAAINALAGAGGKNDAVFAIEIADLKGQRMGMVGGVADSFDDTTGITDGTAGGLDPAAYTLLHFDGANNSISFPDSGAIPRSWYNFGGAKLSTAQSKFGGASLVLDATANTYLATIEGLSDFTFGTGDFTVDFWIRPTTLGASGMLFESRQTSAANNVVIYVNASSKLQYYVGGAGRIASTTTLVVNTWYHVAVCRSSGTTRLFINGVQEGGDYADSTNLLSPPTAIWIGCDYTGAGLFVGYIDEYRVSKTARYTANFTPLSVAYANDPNGSFNYVYDSANDRFSPYSPSQISSPATTTSGAVTYTFINRAFTLTQGYTLTHVGLYSALAGSKTIKITRRVSPGVYDVIASYTFTHPGGGWYDYQLPTPYVVPLDGKQIYLGAVFAGTGATTDVITVSRAYQTTDVAVGNNISGWTEDTAAAHPLRTTYQPNNMTLVSVNYTATSTPANARVALQLADFLSLTPGTDFIMEVSRDGGATWTAVTMTLTMPSFGGVKMYEGSASISGQPSGTSMKWRLKSLTNKAIIASGVVLQYS